MRRFGNLSIRVKLLGGIGFVVVLLAGTLGFAVLQSRAVASRYRDDAVVAARAALDAAQLRGGYSSQSLQWRNLLLRGANADQRAKYTKGFNDATKTNLERRKELGAQIANLGYDPLLAANSTSSATSTTQATASSQTSSTSPKGIKS